MHIPGHLLAIGFLTFAAADGMALSERDAVAEFEGVWISRDLAADTRPAETTVQAGIFDLAIWKTNFGFAVSWKNLDRHGTARITGQFIAAGEPGAFEAIQIDPASAVFQKIGARIKGKRFNLYLSRIGEDGTNQVARYDYSIKNGHMVLVYTLSSGMEVLERVTSTLFRAKVVM